MTRITLLTTGSRGDVQPYIALGVALRQRGFTVRITGGKSFGPLVAQHQLEFAPLRYEAADLGDHPALQRAMYSDNPLKMILSFNELKTLAVKLTDDLFSACDGADAIIYHPGAAIGYFAAQHAGIPAILAAPFPMVPTAAYPSVMFYGRMPSLPWLNRVSYTITQQALWLASTSGITSVWQKQFASPPPNYGMPFNRSSQDGTPILISCSDAVFPRPADWPSNVVQSGYWFLDDLDYTPPVALQQFLDAGDAPLYIGFGSMSGGDAIEKLWGEAIRALKASGERGILLVGRAGRERLASSVPPTIFLLDEAPHSWLFPRMRAIVHHGGAGTTAAALRAGVPQIITPFGNDQYAWAQRTRELGVAPRAIPARKLTADRLMQAIAETQQVAMIDHAAHLGARIRQEDGAHAAAEAVQTFLASQSQRKSALVHESPIMQ